MSIFTSQQQQALKLVVDCILDAARTAGPLGAPSGIIYAALNAHGLTLDAYESILASMTRLGMVKVEHDLVKLAGSAA